MEEDHQDEVADLTEQCRLCLETDTTSGETYPLDAQCRNVEYKTIYEVIKYCLDIDVKSIRGAEFLPQQICGGCHYRLEESYNFKVKSEQTNETLKGILENLGIDTTQGDDPQEHSEHDDSLLQEVEIPPNQEDIEMDSSFTVQESQEGRGSKLYTCRFCSKTFKYSKPFMNHMRTHNPHGGRGKGANGLDKINNPAELRGTKDVTCHICYKSFKYLKTYVNHMTQHGPDVHVPDPTDEYKPPAYASRVEAGEKKRSGRPKKEHPIKTENDSFHDALINFNEFIDPPASYDEAPVEAISGRGRGRPRKRQYTPPVDTSDCDEPIASSSYTPGPASSHRGRGRPPKHAKPSLPPMTSIVATSTKKTYGPHNPHWKQKAAMAKRSAAASFNQEDASYHEESFSIEEPDVVIPGFVEVDLNKVLGKKVIDDNIPVKKTKHTRSPPRSRSRSPSIELIGEEDIFSI